MQTSQTPPDQQTAAIESTCSNSVPSNKQLVDHSPDNSDCAAKTGMTETLSSSKPDSTLSDEITVKSPLSLAELATRHAETSATIVCNSSERRAWADCPLDPDTPPNCEDPTPQEAAMACAQPGSSRHTQQSDSGEDSAKENKEHVATINDNTKAAKKKGNCSLLLLQFHCCCFVYFLQQNC